MGERARNGRRPARALACVLVLLGACGSPPAEPPPTAPAPPAACPSDGAPDAAREARVRARLAEVAEGRALEEGELDGVRAICFGPGPLSVVTHEHVILLERALGDAEAAARLGHLLVHERDGHPMREAVTAESDCEALVHDALAREARAYATEARLRAALGVTAPVMAFEIEAETAALPPAEAEAVWLAYLEAHPEGAPGIDALGRGYRAQCERAREAAASGR